MKIKTLKQYIADQETSDDDDAPKRDYKREYEKFQS